jgi:tryptophanyl-tRNA synthetase
MWCDRDDRAAPFEGIAVMPRRLSGFKPTGPLHLGNYLGAIRPLIDSQYEVDSIAVVADLHALTVEHDPTRIRALSTEVVAGVIAAGLDPTRTVLYVQSHVPAHMELHYILECVTAYGEAHRMIQFREKGATGSTRLSFLTYPVLMAADILLHRADEVPVGDDQSQHLELTRDVAVRFNRRYGEVFQVPCAVNPDVAERIKDLADPTAKMGKSSADQAGVLRLLDPPELLRRKVMRAKTDSGSQVRYDPAGQPGLANLLEILAACIRDEPATLAGLFDSYGELKAAVADAVIATLGPIQARYADVCADPDYVAEILRDGAAAARERTADTLARAYTAIGLRPAA